MANTFAPFGARNFQYRTAAPQYGLTRAFIQAADTIALAAGDHVQNSTAGNYVTGLTTGNGGVPVRGVFVGCEYYQAQTNRIVQGYFPGSISGSTADVVALIMDDPEMTYIIQASTNVTVGTSLVGLNIAIQPSTGNINTLNGSAGLSNVAALSSVIGATNAYPYRIVDVYSNWAPPGTNGTDNTTPGGILVVQPNNWAASNLTARSSS